MTDFWHRLTTSRYVRLLEQERAELRDENQSLKLALFPALQRIAAQRKADTANGVSPQPARPADQRQGGNAGKTEPVRLGRTSWQAARAKLERITDKELMEAERISKAVQTYQ